MTKEQEFRKQTEEAKFEAFSLMCKKVSDLENANAELKERNAELKGMYAHSAREAGTYKQFLEAKEKENAELKKTVTKMNNVITETFSNLTKAKELLKQWLQTSNASSCDNINIVTDTEQFLKDNEVEK